MIIVYETAEHPTTNITWLENGVLLDLSQFTFSAKITSCRDPKRTFTKTTNIQGLRGARPNVIIKWSVTTDIDVLIPGLYSMVLTATQPTDSTTYILKDTMLVRPA